VQCQPVAVGILQISLRQTEEEGKKSGKRSGKKRRKAEKAANRETLHLHQMRCFPDWQGRKNTSKKPQNALSR
jgi:hypothetical protein